jgi:gamma-glutamyl-gamma-aminobutyrate hydrolase PuuD
VLCGGTLHQHIPDLVGCDKHMQHKQGIAPHIPVVPILIKDGTTLAHIAQGIKMPFISGNSSGSPKVIMENIVIPNNIYTLFTI